MKKVTTEITYRVSDGFYCNIGSMLAPSAEKCRFCVKHGKGYFCALHNDLLDTKANGLVMKSAACEKAVCGFRSVVEDVPATPPAVDVKALIQATIDEYESTRKSLIAQGYPEAVAVKVAKQAMGGK